MTTVASRTSRTSRTSRRKSLRVLGWVAAAIVTVVVLALIALVFILPVAAGGTARSVRTGSMAPALPVGSLIIDRPVSPTALDVGDIATYRENDDGVTRYVTHRVVGVAGPSSALRFTFRGDANSTADPRSVPAAAVVGKVWLHVPYVGSIADRLTNVRWVLVGLGVLALGSYSAWQIAGGLRERQEDSS
jgi:signal peptidase